MSKVTVTSEDLNKLGLALDGLGDEAVEQGKEVLGRGAYNVKKDAQAKSSGIAHAPDYPRAITYSTSWTGTLGEAEIGPDKNRRQGALGNILEYGTVNSPPFAHLGPALDYEGPRFTEQVEQLGVDVLEAL